MRTYELDAVVRELELYGIRPEIENISKHLAINWEYNGHKGRQVVPSSGSDSSRGWLNARGDVRRWLRLHNAVIPAHVKPAILQKALALPSPQDTGPARLRTLEQNFDALLDMVADLSAANTELSNVIASLNARFNNMKIVSHVTFEEPAPAQVPAQVVPILSLVERKAAVRNTGSAAGSAAVLEFLKDGRWKSRNEIAETLGADVTRVSQTLNYLSTKKLVENGLRGMWRKVIVAETLLAAALTNAVLEKEQREDTSS